MPKILLTDVTVRALKPPPTGQTTFWDKSLPGFGCRVSVAGTKSWVVMTGRDRKLITLSRYPDVSLKDARITAKHAATQPTKPVEGPMTLKTAIDTFLTVTELKTRPKTMEGYRGCFNRHFTPLFHRSLRSLTTHELMGLVDGIAATPTEQLHLFVITKTFLRFCVRRRLLDTNPLDGLPAPGRYRTRERTLSDREIATVWRAATEHRFQIGIIIRLCILTGQRRGEIATLTWEMIDRQNRTITIPASIAKNKTTSTFPYGPMVEAILDELPTEKGYLFPGRSQGHFGGFGRGKLTFEKECDIDPWQLHDLRRTFSTVMASLGVQQIVVEKLLNHVSGGSQSPISRVYNRHAYMSEMRQAIGLYEAHLAKLVATA